ncbi:MAG: IclR family transcriptional regulator [Rhodococcus sp.]|uniref:IclR family transcriptional regulator domain-containing protein n=1 Tax=unclassified Rhodococcus (in: high G+C Gram-positive bacteria) TaxID=192944 RepID=UPI00146E199A|nr:IclR family transcriptional regulator [Rhodococcus sp. F64268]MCK0091183.1 IclR family transcriptional regulator [Rhodococcus sp. F64268]NLE82337.1 IclR family transcriptional regulator [Rhodococcus sp. (in: high G+C Gram-positive bacteria)]NLU63928.1 IclR family transcriptional regulator [Rhodococcus sp. HNM0563]
MTVQSSHPPVPTATLDRLSSVLDAFDGPGRLTLSGVVRRTGLPRSSAHRMLDQLVRMRWLRRDGRDYELGMRLIELGSIALEQDRVHRAAVPVLHELHRMTGCVVHLAVLDDTDIVYLEKIGGRLAGSVPTRVGGRRPARHTAAGKAMLAATALDDADLVRVRESGFAFEKEESLRGFGCVAASIGPEHDPVAAISVCGPVRSMPFDHRLANPVRAAATRIWRDYQDQLVGVSPVLGRNRAWSTHRVMEPA